jgi:hypothetical protein
MEIPEYSEADKIFNKFKEMLQQNKSPKELLYYLNENIDKLNESSADIAIARVIELQSKQVTKYEEKFLDVDYAKQLEDIETKEVHDITNDEVREWAEEVIDNGFKLGSNEITIDYEKINTIASDYVSSELKDYIKIESNESSKKYSSKESLDLYLTNADNSYLSTSKRHTIETFVVELSSILNDTFEYTSKYDESPYIVRVNQLKSEYLQVFFFGSPNNSTFSYYQGYDKENNKIDSNWNNAYLNTMEEYEESEFEVFLSNYYNELSKSNGFLNKDLYDYINRKINNQDS